MSKTALWQSIKQAVESGNRSQMVRLFEVEGVDPNFVGSMTWTPLHVAASAADVDTIRYLTDQCFADVTATMQGSDTTPRKVTMTLLDLRKPAESTTERGTTERAMRDAILALQLRETARCGDEASLRSLIDTLPDPDAELQLGARVARAASLASDVDSFLYVTVPRYHELYDAVEAVDGRVAEFATHEARLKQLYNLACKARGSGGSDAAVNDRTDAREQLSHDGLMEELSDISQALRDLTSAQIEPSGADAAVAAAAAKGPRPGKPLVPLPPFAAEYVAAASTKLGEWRNGNAALSAALGAFRAKFDVKSAIIDDARKRNDLVAMFLESAKLSNLVSDLRLTFPHAQATQHIDRYKSDPLQLLERISEAMKTIGRVESVVRAVRQLPRYASGELQRLIELKHEVLDKAADVQKARSALNAEIRKKSSKIAELREQLRTESEEWKALSTGLCDSFNKFAPVVAKWFPELMGKLEAEFPGYGIPRYDPSLAISDFTTKPLSGDVMLAFDVEGKGWIVKQFPNRDAALRECNALNTLKSPYVVDLHASFVEESTNGSAHSHYAMLQYYEGGDVDKWFETYKADAGAGPLVLRLVHQIATGYESIHAFRVIHGDCKCQNIVMSNKSRNNSWPLIIDFDVALTPEERSTKLFTTVAVTAKSPIVGFTHGYAAPEIVGAITAGDLVQCATPAIDIYALGIVVSVLLGVNGRDTANWSLPDDTSVLSQELRPVRAELESFVRRMLARDPTCRPTAAEVAAAFKNFCTEVNGVIEEQKRCVVSGGVVDAATAIRCTRVVNNSDAWISKSKVEEVVERWSRGDFEEIDAAEGRIRYVDDRGEAYELSDSSVMQVWPAALRLLDETRRRWTAKKTADQIRASKSSGSTPAAAAAAASPTSASASLAYPCPHCKAQQLVPGNLVGSPAFRCTVASCKKPVFQ